MKQPPPADDNPPSSAARRALPRSGPGEANAGAAPEGGALRSHVARGTRLDGRCLSTGETILVVDDDALVRKTLGEVLVSWGYSVDLAEHGVEATRCLAKQEYNVIITDFQMPMMDGVALWRHAVAAGYPGIWILMTGSTGPQLERPVPVLHKPFRLRDLRNILESSRPTKC